MFGYHCENAIAERRCDNRNMSEPPASASDRIQRRKALGRSLRELRERARLTGTQLAAQSGLSRSHLSRIENGWVAPNAATVKSISKVLDLDKAQMRGLLHEVALLSDGEPQETNGGGNYQSQETLMLIERSSRGFRSSCGNYIAAFLQTFEYTEAMIEMFARSLPQSLEYDISHEVLLRARRIAEMADPQKHFSFLLDQRVLSAQPLGSRHVDLVSQLVLLEATASRPNISIRLAEPATHVMDILLLDDKYLAYDTPAGYSISTSPEEIELFETFWDTQSAKAFSEDESLQRIRGVREQLQDTQRTDVILI